MTTGILRATDDASAEANRPPRWAVVAAYAVPAGVLPSAVWRCTLLLDGTVDLDAEGWYLLILSVGSLGLALLTLGLVHPWGERVPRWVPFLGGRAIPAPAVAVPAMAGALLLIGLCLYALLNPVFHWVEQAPVLIGPTRAEASRPQPGSEVAALYLPMLTWGPLLLVVAGNYARRRRHGAN
ncbi:hypothetical protein AB0M36_22715 [Actinoplanes sp. NPDC051346]|uniref:hypothetical protein n=1 Tax=Actinoplanes sp. NPDC051346 TaxID=3155048 RepID=UPI003430C9FD